MEPQAGLESALRSCQDKHLDIFAFEMAESAKATNAPIDPHELSGWVQRAICNINTFIFIKRRRAILFGVDPKLAYEVLTDTGKGLTTSYSFNCLS